MRSISDNNSQRLSKLLRYGAGLKITPDDLNTALISAIRQSRPECVASILKAGGDANTSDEEGKPALYVLMESGRGNPEILKALLNAGANPNKVTWATQQTALHAASRKGYQVCIKHLLVSGAHVTRQDSAGYTPLMYAAREGHITILRALLAENADPNIHNNNHETALHLAVKNHHSPCVDQLLCQQADPSLTDSKGQSALFLAIKDGHDELIDLLIEHKSAVNSQDKATGKTILHLAIEGGNLPLIAKLLRQGADPNVRDKDWQTPFLMALNMGRRDIMEQLLRAGCKITATDRSFNTPLHIASINGQADMIHLFIERGLDVNLKGSGGMTPIMLAAFGAHTKTVQIILQYGADSSLTDRNHASALVYAILSKGSVHHIYDVVKCLIKSNCDVDKAANLHKIVRTFSIELDDGIQVDQRLYSPLELAFIRGDAALFMMLLSAGCDTNSFHCDRDQTLQNFKSVHSDLKSRWLLLRYLKKEKKRVKSLKELCRRPLLKTFGQKVGMTVNALPISEQLKRFLKFTDVSEACERYANEDNDFASPQSPSTPTHVSSPFQRGQRVRSTIHLAGGTSHRRKSLNEPSTPILPKASWDSGETIKKSGEARPRSGKQRSHSITSPGFSSLDRRRIASASNAANIPHSPLSPQISVPIDEDEILDTPKVGFFHLMKPKSKKEKMKDPKARSKRSRDPRETITMLLHGSSEEYTSSGEITPRPLDMASIEALNEIEKSPTDDYESVNKMLYGKSLKTEENDKKDSDITARIKNMRKQTIMEIEASGVEGYINSGEPTTGKSRIMDEVFDFNSKMKALTNGDTDIENRRNTEEGANRAKSTLSSPYATSRNSSVKHEDIRNNKSTLNSPFATPKDSSAKNNTIRRYPNGEPISPESTPNTIRKRYDQLDNANSFRGHSNGIKRSNSTSSSSNGYIPNDWTKLNGGPNNNIGPRDRYSSTGSFEKDYSYSPAAPRNGYVNQVAARNANRRPPSLDISQTDSYNSPSPLSPPTSNTDSYDSSGGSSAAAVYQYPSGDPQLMHKYLSSQDMDDAVSQGVNSMHITGSNSRPQHITTTNHRDLNGNSNSSHLSNPMTQSAHFATDYNGSLNVNSKGGRVRTSSVGSYESTGSRLSQGSSRRTPGSKIPIFQSSPKSPAVTPRSKLPVPVSSPYTATSRGFGNFQRSQSVRKW